MIVHRNRLKLCFEPPVQQDTYQCRQNYGEIINSDVGAGRTDATVERSRTLNSGEGDNSFTQEDTHEVEDMSTKDTTRPRRPRRNCGPPERFGPFIQY